MWFKLVLRGAGDSFAPVVTGTCSLLVTSRAGVTPPGSSG
jgi:hypothetical protein